MSNSFGRLLRLTSFGESHGPAVGGVIEGVPAGLTLDEERIQAQVDRRRPGQSTLTTARNEADRVEWLSGLYQGQTTGMPLAFAVRNEDARPADYDRIAQVYRPSHADFTWTEKYGLRDPRGGGRSSARETLARVVAGAVAEQLLERLWGAGFRLLAWTDAIYTHQTPGDAIPTTRAEVDAHPTRCPHPTTAAAMQTAIEQAREAGDSLGGVVRCRAVGLPVGLGQPVFDKLPALLAHALLSINATKGFELGSGFAGTQLTGAAHNDAFYTDEAGQVRTRSNHSGGTQGGLSNGMPLEFRVAFKPTATIARAQETVTTAGEATTLAAPGRHDPCVVPRAVPIVEAMALLVLADLALLDRSSRV